MNYFINAQERKSTHSTQFFEFVKGRYCGRHWSEDSIYLHADEFDRLELQKAFQIVPLFNYYGPSSIDREQWTQILEQAPQLGQETVAALEEASLWVQECFSKNECFTILGI